MKNSAAHTLPGVTPNMGPILLEGSIQHYEWGERGPKAFIPKLLGRPAENGRPYAELWLGAHPAKPSLAQLGSGKISLEEVIGAYPKSILGPNCHRRFKGRLPFLVKILDIACPLSVQAHPNDRQAKQGFRREERSGVPLDAPNRNYRDDRAKPELVIALTDFYALCRFRPWAEIVRSLKFIPTFSALLTNSLNGRLDDASANPLKRLYRHLMMLPQEKTDVLLEAFIRDVSKTKAPSLWKTIRPWLMAADKGFSVNGHRDRGLFAFFLLNFIRLKPGEALFLPAGELHAYLGGRAVEVMSNSDNVLRGGLTVKHVDVAELLKILAFVSHKPGVLTPNRNGRYSTTAKEFDVRVLNFESHRSEVSVEGLDRGPALILNLAGTILLSWMNKQHLLRPGQSVLIPSCVRDYRLKALSPKAQAFLTGIASRPAVTVGTKARGNS